jgi:hypothetical protein
MLVRGVGIRDISVIFRISVAKILRVLTSGVYTVKPKKKCYDCLETDEFWTYLGEKRTKSGLFMPIIGNRERLWGMYGESGT